VRIGDTVTARATITDLVPEKRRATIATVATVRNKVVLEGEAVVMVPQRAALKPAANGNGAAERAPGHD
jgi:3-hydroxybutyryl-CoA dehydratase